MVSVRAVAVGRGAKAFERRSSSNSLREKNFQDRDKKDADLRGNFVETRNEHSVT